MFDEQRSINLLRGPSLVSSLCIRAILKVALYLPGKWRHLPREVLSVPFVGDLGSGANIHLKFPVIVTLSGTYQPGHRL